MTIDTLAAAKSLARAGMENGQAEAVANVVRDATADLATKADLDVLERRMDERLTANEGRMDERLAANESRFHAELKAGLADLKADFYKWMWVMGAGIVGILLTAITVAFGIAVWLFA